MYVYLFKWLAFYWLIDAKCIVEYIYRSYKIWFNIRILLSLKEFSLL